MITSKDILSLLEQLDITHVVSVPDSTIGALGDAVAHHSAVRLVRACREGECWAIAGGLYLGGANPLVLMQCTGLFESGDALRNVIHDWRLPLLSVIGYRSYLDQSTIPGDTCLVFTEPVLDAWRLPYVLVDSEAQLDVARTRMQQAREVGESFALLLAEGKA